MVNRLATDSFRMKGWSVGLVAALFVLLARVGRFDFGHITLIPLLIFWGLDGYLLMK